MLIHSGKSLAPPTPNPNQASTSPRAHTITNVQNQILPAHPWTRRPVSRLKAISAVMPRANDKKARVTRKDGEVAPTMVREPISCMSDEMLKAMSGLAMD